MREVIAPILFEVAVADDRAHLEDGLGAVEAPSGAGDVHAVLDQVPAGTLDDAGGDWPPALESGGVVEVRPLANQVDGALVDGRPGGPVETLPSGLAPDGGGDAGGLALQDSPRPVSNPAFGVGVALVVEAPGRLPQVLQHMDEVDHDRHVDLAGVGFGLDAVELMVVAIDERDPGATVVGVTPLGLVEGPADHGGSVLHHAGHQPLVASPRSRPRDVLSVVSAGQDVVRRAGNGTGVVDAADLGHALAVALLALREPRGQLVRAPRRSLGGGGAQRVRTHDDALAVARDDEDVVRVAGGLLPLLVESVEVGRGPLDQGLQLALAQALTSAPPDRLPNVVEGAARPLQDRQPAQAVGVELDRQVQVRISGVQVGVTALAVGQASDLDLAEHAQ